uniref:Biotin synthase n=1 Tax=uncultured marine thaumarchaeote KM3_173_D12 TaxID=1456049 RepID=A0A075GJW4_9ARCH|nr:biotin synthase (bioB) [uncultured marine thaumarchaeote KM3_173_D12]
MHQKREMILNCRDDIINGKKIIEPIISELFNISNEFLLDLSDAANRITRHYHGSKVDIEELANIKKNFCSEDCTFCSQSAFFNTKITGYELPSPEEIVEQALNAKNDGAGSFCLVAAWREPNTLDFEKVCTIIEEINKKVGISVECSLGFLTDRQAKTLKKLQVKRYNHNLETSRSKFPEICTTHTYDDRVKTLKIARNAGLELCTGGIIGLGETRKQREELILEISELEPEEVTVNMLVPMPGTPLELQTQLDITEIMRVFSTLRFLLPKSIIKISGGREVNLKDDGQKLLLSGANGIISAGYLTMGGNAIKKDTEMINEINLEA